MPLRIFPRVSTLLLTVASLLIGCATPHVPSRMVYEDPVNYVRLQEDERVLPDWPLGYFSHPAPIRRETLRAVLSGLRIREHRIAPQRWFQGEAPLVPTFTEEEVVFLSEHLAEGLAEAKYNERVTFYLSQPLTFARRTITSGGIYVKGTELHVLLGNWRIVYGVPAYGMIYDRRYPMRPTSPKGFDLLFESSEAVIPQKSSLLDDLFANTRDELVIDMSKVKVQEPAPLSLSSPVFWASGTGRRNQRA